MAIRIRRNSSQAWMDIEVDRVDQSYMATVIPYPQPDGETSLNQIEAAKYQCILTYYITMGSGLPGTTPVDKAMNLVEFSKSWYFELDYAGTDLPQVEINGTSYYFLFQKVIVKMEASICDKIVEGQMSLIMRNV